MSTEECKLVIIECIEDSFSDYTDDMLNEKNWKRISKHKNENGHWVREFRYKDITVSVGEDEEEGEFFVFKVDGLTSHGGSFIKMKDEWFQMNKERKDGWVRSTDPADFYFFIKSNSIIITPKKYFDDTGHSYCCEDSWQISEFNFGSIDEVGFSEYEKQKCRSKYSPTRDYLHYD